ncbi:ATP-binding protein [Psychromonas sp. MB-3u-54]|uniref:ATP-binding protein n=1 Tax=Psychromonas sp. MB-3u-54 TaxID=2058319 RepID=UPI0012FF0D62|nr:ATP-binding protein [Psychromonas sp. MB-3u-54]
MSFYILNSIMGNINYPLSLAHKNKNNTYTVLIGKNGSGKSNLLSFIANFFYRDNSSFYERPDLWEIGADLSELDKYYRKNSIRYNLKGHEVNAGEIGKELAGIYCAKPFPKVHSAVFPKRVICVSTSPFDRFPIKDISHANFFKDPHNKKHQIYSYIGLKRMDKTIHVNSLINSIVQSLFTKADAVGKNLIVMEKTLEYLGYGRRIRVSFSSKFTKDKVNFYGIDKLINEHLVKLIELNTDESNDLDKLVDLKRSEVLKAFINLYGDSNKSVYKRLSVDLHLGKVSSPLEKIKINSIELLLNLEVLKVHSLNLSHKSDNRKFIDFKKASSGEQCIALILLGISGKIKNNSLICIDEPEISLHPEWQSSFMSLLIKTFENYDGCHFIIATHSPQIVSELHGENSYILSMDENKLFSARDYLLRSADYQLATLFDSPGFRNEFLNRKVVSLLSYLSKNGNLGKEQKVEADQLFHLLPKINTEDPVRILIELLNETLEIINNDH